MLPSIFQKTDLFLFKIAVLNDPRLQQLSAAPNYTARVRLADTLFAKIKAGSGRIAYDYSTDLVLKLAKNDKGVAQNKVEADNFLQTNYKNLVANVVDAEPDDKWLVMEKATKISPAKFKNLTGIDFNNLSKYLHNKNPVRRPPFELPIENQEALDNNPLIGELLDMMSNFQMPPGDFCKASSWGEVRGRVVLVDYGLTSEVQSEFYSK